MIYGRQINWAKAHNNNFDDGSGWLLQNSLIDLLFISTRVLWTYRNGWKSDFLLSVQPLNYDDWK